MAKARGKYASPAQAKRRKRILRETLKLLQEASPADISMGQIAELSDVSTKTLHNLFKSRNIADITGDGVITDNSNLIPRNTPENTFGVITTYDADFGPGTLQTTVSYRYRDTVEIEASNAPFGHMDSINDLSGSISYLWSDNRYRITLYGKNLTDDQELAQGTIAPLTTRGWWTAPRTIGAEFAISF